MTGGRPRSQPSRVFLLILIFSGTRRWFRTVPMGTSVTRRSYPDRWVEGGRHGLACWQTDINGTGSKAPGLSFSLSSGGAFDVVARLVG